MDDIVLWALGITVVLGFTAAVVGTVRARKSRRRIKAVLAQIPPEHLGDMTVGMWRQAHRRGLVSDEGLAAVRERHPEQWPEEDVK